MTDFVSWMANWVASGFFVGSLLLGLLVLWFACWQMLFMCLEAVLNVGSLMEAAIEAKRQGRAPIFKAWLRRGGKGDDE